MGFGLCFLSSLRLNCLSDCPFIRYSILCSDYLWLLSAVHVPFGCFNPERVIQYAETDRHNPRHNRRHNDPVHSGALIFQTTKKNVLRFPTNSFRSSFFQFNCACRFFKQFADRCLFKNTFYRYICSFQFCMNRAQGTMVHF